VNLSSLFQKAPEMRAEAVKELMKQKRPDEYNLIDVRQPGEYEQGHIPGAKLIPITELASRMGELDPSKSTILY
jgi:sulfur-carrier protein adenylyltransferase/sulfurtransferase